MSFDAAHIITALSTVAIIVVVVIFHYEGLYWLSRLSRSGRVRHRPRIIVMIFGQLLLHCASIWVFGLGYYMLLQHPDFGSLEPMAIITIGESVYYSAVVYSTLGFGDVISVGPIRFLTGMEAVTGLVMITWSASFTFVEMQRNWES